MCSEIKHENGDMYVGSHNIRGWKNGFGKLLGIHAAHQFIEPKLLVSEPDFN
jgi:hypothetical protein